MHFQDYRERWGTRCAGCGEYVEGDVVTAGDKHSFHPNCFHCQRCRQPLLGEGTKVTLVQGEQSVLSFRSKTFFYIYVCKSNFEIFDIILQVKLCAIVALVYRCAKLRHRSVPTIIIVVLQVMSDLRILVHALVVANDCRKVRLSLRSIVNGTFGASSVIAATPFYMASTWESMYFQQLLSNTKKIQSHYFRVTYPVYVHR